METFYACAEIHQALLELFLLEKWTSINIIVFQRTHQIQAAYP